MNSFALLKYGIAGSQKQPLHGILVLALSENLTHYANDKLKATKRTAFKYIAPTVY
jgi:hypothetical protein